VKDEYDPNKTLGEYSFSHIPVWMWVYKLPLGKMSKDVWLLIDDNRVGVYMEMDCLENDMTVGKCLRVKVKKCVAEALMRGTMVEPWRWTRKIIIWCPLEYKYLLQYCHNLTIEHC
jgi:hypothetical protein